MNRNKRLDINEIRNYQLEMLSYIDKVCRKNNIKYSLAYGSMLGAVRHQGFIPWDDDVDIMLSPQEYFGLIEILKADDKFRVLTPKSKNYALCYSKLIHPDTYAICDDGYKHNEINGVFIDIFPLWPLKNIEEELQALKKYEKKAFVANEKGILAFVQSQGIIKSISRIPWVLYCKAVGKKFWSKKIVDFLRNNMNVCTYYGLIPWEEKYCMDKSFFEEVEDVRFDKLTLMIYKEYDEILTNRYGEYMKLPPEEERHFPHTTEVMYRK